MELHEQDEELLETLWVRTEEKKEGATSVSDPEIAMTPLDSLLKAGYISLAGGKVELTEKGKPEAASVVRRHRLAERLLADVLGIGHDHLEDKACKFEHLLDRGLDESICILLGHPRVCPHGKTIPPGRCCQQDESLARKLVSPLSRLAPGQKGKVAYIYAPETGKLQKLIAMGIHPGAQVSLVQSFPSFVFQSGQSQFAVDREIAEAIYVRLLEEEYHPREEEIPQPHHRFRLGKRKGARRSNLNL